MCFLSSIPIFISFFYLGLSVFVDLYRNISHVSPDHHHALSTINLHFLQFRAGIGFPMLFIDTDHLTFLNQQNETQVVLLRQTAEWRLVNLPFTFSASPAYLYK